VSDQPSPPDLGYRALPVAARLYVAAVIAGGLLTIGAFFPREWPNPVLFTALLVCTCLTASWKVSLPISLKSGSTLSLSHAANLMALLILGPGPAIVIATIGSWTQCTFNVRQPYPWYRTAFSMAAEAITVAAASAVYSSLGGLTGPTDFFAMSRPLVAAIATYFLVNTGLVAVAIAFSLRKNAWRVWHDDFVWSAPSFVVAGAFGVVAAIVVVRGWQWAALLTMAPLYLTYHTYRMFLSRLDEQRRHVEETQQLHTQTVAALLQARRAEHALAAEKERLAVTLRSIADGLITTDLNGTILSINSAAEALTGWKMHEAAGQPLGGVFRTFDPQSRQPCEASVEWLIERTRTPGAGGCTILVARNLAERPVESSAAPVCDADGRAVGMVLAFRDITDALRIQEEHAKASRLASLGLLAGGIARDFNNVLMAIMGNISVARATRGEGERAMTALARAEDACLQARQLTWQLLTFARGGMPRKTTVALEPVLRDSAAMVLRGSSTGCTIECSPDLWTLHADEDQILQVFNSVLLNAQQSMAQGGAITVKAGNVYEATERSAYGLRIAPGPYVRISIADRGVGIPKEHLGRIFDPYFTTKERGGGLGLATTHSIVKNHGGFVAIDSQPGHGTTVHITLPASAEEQALDTAQATRRSQGNRHRVLVMDDEESIRTLAVNMLEFLGYTCEVAESGSAAVERFTHALHKGHPFDVVMLDLIVPGGPGGKEAMDRLSLIDPSVKAIVMSGYSHASAMTRFRDFGFHAAISKPFTLQELSSTLQAVVALPSHPVH
jgi:PAS domain S-box-containing protein